MVKVSICLPTYNRSHFLTYAVQSVFEQTYRDWELIICDDGSIDNTPELVKNWQDSQQNLQIIYLRQEQNIRRSLNMQAGFQAAQGEYFIKFDDDALTPVSAGLIVDLLRETLQHQSLQVGSTLFRKSCLDQLGFMRPEADGCEDFDLLVRLAIAKFQGYFLPEYLMEYRFHNAQNSLKQDIHFLSAKAFCLDSYSFSDPELTHIQQYKLAGTKQALAMRLLQIEESSRSRKLIRESEKILGKSLKTSIAYLLS